MSTQLCVRRATATTMDPVDETNPLPVEVIGQLGAFAGTGLMLDSNSQPLVPKFAAISTASQNANTLVAAVTGKKIRVLAAFLMSAGITTVTFQSGASGTTLVGAVALTAQVGFTLPFNPMGWFETTASTLLNLNNSAAIQVSGCLVYVETV